MSLSNNERNAIQNIVFLLFKHIYYECGFSDARTVKQAKCASYGRGGVRAED